MSDEMQSHIFLPTYLLKYVHDGPTSGIDTDLFLTEASTSRLLEVLHTFCPNLKFTEDAKNDRQLLEMIFCKQVAHQLSYYVMIPENLQPSVKYFSAPLKIPIYGPQDSDQIITCAADYNRDRSRMFTCSFLTALKDGQYHLAAENLIGFLKIYKYLTEEEYFNIFGAQDIAEDTLTCNVNYLKEAYEAIESIQLLMREADISVNCFQDLETKLKATTITLNYRQKMFDRSIQDVALITALGKYHKNKHTANRQFNPPDLAGEPEGTPNGASSST